MASLAADEASATEALVDLDSNGGRPSEAPRDERGKIVGIVV